MKKVFAMILCLATALTLVACGEGAPVNASSDPVSDSFAEDLSSVTNAVASDVVDKTDFETTDSETDIPMGTSADTDTDTDISSVNSDWGIITEDVVPNLVIANDQIKERVVVYDFDKYEKGDSLDDLEVWSVDTGHAAGVKYRENTVFGDVVIVAGSVSAIYRYPSKEVVWSTKNPGNNPHSIEILPSGNIIIANSSGSCLRVFSVSALLNGDKSGAQQFVDYSLAGAHGVLWDPEYECLWALGTSDLVAYAVSGSGVNETLTKISDRGCRVPGQGHDLQPDYTDSRYLYLTAGKAYRFDKEENTVGGFPQSEGMQLSEIKGFSINPNGKYFSTGVVGGAGTFFENHWKASWLTDTIVLYVRKVVKNRVVVSRTEISSKTSAFYKVRAFYGQYQ